MRSAYKKYVKEASINDQKIEALIDTESDICLIYLICLIDQYIRVGAPKLEKKIRFRGVGSSDNVILTM